MFAVCNMFTGQGAGALYDRLFASTAEVVVLIVMLPPWVLALPPVPKMVADQPIFLKREPPNGTRSCKVL